VFEVRLALAVDRGYVAVQLDQPLVRASCAEPAVAVQVDDRWFALCGGGKAATRAIESGLVVAGRHEITAYRVGDTCARSRTIEVAVPCTTCEPPGSPTSI
jgi:hypothetical protein